MLSNAYFQSELKNQTLTTCNDASMMHLMWFAMPACKILQSNLSWKKAFPITLYNHVWHMQFTEVTYHSDQHVVILNVKKMQSVFGIIFSQSEKPAFSFLDCCHVCEIEEKLSNANPMKIAGRNRIIPCTFEYCCGCE